MRRPDYEEINRQISNLDEKGAKDMLEEVIDNTYTMVEWPEVQDLMDEPWFVEEAILDNREDAPSSSYLIPTKYVLR
jgi:hypothetical protein